MPDTPKFPSMLGSTGFIHHTEEAPTYWMQDIMWTMLADANDTGGRWSMMEQLMPMGAGPPPHKHLWSDETFYILDGTITFLLEGEIKTASKGAFVNIARNTRHAFRVDSDTARILNGYTPASMEAMIAELGKRTTEHTLPPPGPPMPPGKPQMPDELLTRYGLIWLDEPDPLAPGAIGKARPMAEHTPELPAIPGSLPFVHNVDSAPAYWWLDILWVILVKGEDTGGRYSLMYEALPKGSGAPPHKHTWSDEHFYMLDGEITFLLGDEIKVGRKGDFIFVPRDTRHAFRVDQQAAFLNGYTPSGLELAIAELGMPAPTRTIPPKGATPPPSLTAEQQRRYGMDNLPGPNPLDPDPA